MSQSYTRGSFDEERDKVELLLYDMIRDYPSDCPRGSGTLLNIMNGPLVTRMLEEDEEPWFTPRRAQSREEGEVLTTGNARGKYQTIQNPFWEILGTPAFETRRGREASALQAEQEYAQPPDRTSPDVCADRASLDQQRREVYNRVNAYRHNHGMAQLEMESTEDLLRRFRMDLYSRHD